MNPLVRSHHQGAKRLRVQESFSKETRNARFMNGIFEEDEGATFSRNSQMAQYPCSLCPKVFKTHRQLEAHFTHHEVEKFLNTGQILQNFTKAFPTNLKDAGASSQAVPQNIVQDEKKEKVIGSWQIPDNEEDDLFCAF